MKFLPTNGVLALIGEETFMFAASGDMVFLNRGTLCGRGGRGDFEVVAMFVCSNHSAPKSSEVLGNPSEYRTSSIESKVRRFLQFRASIQFVGELFLMKKK